MPEPQGHTLSRCFCCVKCGEPIHDSQEQMFALFRLEDGEEIYDSGPYHQKCLPEPK